MKKMRMQKMKMTPSPKIEVPKIVSEEQVQFFQEFNEPMNF
jgi:hypothetical protein